MDPLTPDPVSLQRSAKLRRPPSYACPAQWKADVHLWSGPWGRICREARGLAADILQAEAEALEKAAG